MRQGNFKRKLIRNKICISIFSFIFFLILLEIILRIMGYIYFSKQVSSDGIFSRFKKEKGMYNILCLGDSFTFGGGVDAKDTYPSQLQRILDSNYAHKSIKVINGGYCEINSAQVLQRLPKNIRYYNPDAVILLVGASSRFNFIGFNKEKTIYSKLKDAIYNLRVYKMLKIVILNLKVRFLLRGLKRDVDREPSEVLDNRALLNAINPNRHIFEDITDTNQDLVAYLNQIGENEKASELFERSLSVDPNSDLFLHQISQICEEIYEQTNYSSGSAVLATFQEKVKNNPDLKNDRLFMDYFLFFQNILRSYKEEEIDRRLREDLEEIVNMCREYNVKLILQDYPYPYPYADKALRDIAMKYSLPSVENSRVFGELLIKGKRETYFQDDTHCTPLGYRIMAENIYKLIVSEDIFPNNQEGR